MAGRKDISKLVKKVIVNTNGKRQTVYVKPNQPSTSLFNATSKLEKYEKLFVQGIVDHIKNKYKIDPKITVRGHGYNDNQFGDIVLGENALKHHKFTLKFDNDAHYRMQIVALMHELVHVKQVVKKELGLSKDKKYRTWKGRKHTSVKDYNKMLRTKDFKSYKNLPWEKEAYGNQTKLMNSLLRSKHWKGMKGKDATLDFIIDNI